MDVTAESAAYVASLGDNKTLEKLLERDEVDYTIIKNLEDQVINLAGALRSNKGGGTTRRIKMVITPVQFALILNMVPFLVSVYPEICDYKNPTACTTN